MCRCTTCHCQAFTGMSLKAWLYGFLFSCTVMLMHKVQQLIWLSGVSFRSNCLKSFFSKCVEYAVKLVGNLLEITALFISLWNATSSKWSKILQGLWQIFKFCSLESTCTQQSESWWRTHWNRAEYLTTSWYLCNNVSTYEPISDLLKTKSACFNARYWCSMIALDAQPCFALQGSDFFLCCHHFAESWLLIQL